MDLHLLPKSGDVLASISNLSGNTLLIHAAASFLRIEMANVQRKVIATRMTGTVAGKLAEKSTSTPLLFYLKDKIDDHDGLDILPFLDAEQFS